MFQTSVLVGVFLAAVLAADAVPLMCLRFCGNEEFSPVCGYNGKVLKIFKNECELKNADCGDDDNWKLQPIAECLSGVGKDIPVIPLYPIVGYPPIVKQPEDEQPSDPIADDPIVVDPIVEAVVFKASCDAMCPDYYLPACGFDGTNYRSFSNICFMGVYNCNNGESFEYAPAEKCHFNTEVFY